MTSVSVQSVAREAVAQVHEGSRNFPFVSEKPPQPPEGKLIGEAMKRRGMSARGAATAAGISDTRWRHIVAGYQPVGELYVPVSGPAETVARMARAVGVLPHQLAEVGRQDAANELTRLQRDDEVANRPVGTGVDPLDLTRISEEEYAVAAAAIMAMRRARGERHDQQDQ